MTRARVQQYQRYFADADRVLILLHNDPDPDALASGLALRNLLRRTKTTAIIGAMQGVTRPENLRMANMLDIHVEQITPASFAGFDRIATVDVQPHYFGGLLDRADLVIDHHPEQPGYSAVFKDIRADYGSTSHDPDRAPARRGRQHLRAHGDGDALRDQVRHAVLRAPHQPRRSRGVHVPLSARRRGADPEDGRGGNHARAARVRDPREPAAGSCATGVHARSSARRRARTSSPTPPTSSCSSKTSSGRSSPASSATTLIVSVRNLGYSRNAGEFVKRWFADIGQRRRPSRDGQGGRADRRFREKYGDLDGPAITARIAEMAEQFLHEAGGREDYDQKFRCRVASTSNSHELTWTRLLRRLIDDPRSDPRRSSSPDRRPRHAAGDAGARELLVGVAPTARSAPAGCRGSRHRRGWRRA